jgi:hypothetical protein|tara:strand:+ start:14655 stop:14849 length:195 start_codon:yes stop_codon:yes gene_type:complete
MKLKMINEIIGKFCPTTIILNVGAIGVSLTDLEIGLKLLSYSVAIIWTTLKIAKEIKTWNEKNG